MKMPIEEYKFCRDATPADWSALPRDMKVDDVVKRFHGHTYGLDRDDMTYLGVESIPCYLPEQDGTTFFTIPVDFLIDKDGNHPDGDYISREKLRAIIGKK